MCQGIIEYTQEISSIGYMDSTQGFEDDPVIASMVAVSKRTSLYVLEGRYVSLFLDDKGAFIHQSVPSSCIST